MIDRAVFDEIFYKPCYSDKFDNIFLREDKLIFRCELWEEIDYLAYETMKNQKGFIEIFGEEKLKFAKSWYGKHLKFVVMILEIEQNCYESVKNYLSFLQSEDTAFHDLAYNLFENLHCFATGK